MDIKKDVFVFLKKAGDFLGNHTSEYFQVCIINTDFEKYNISSPIEQILYITLKSLSGLLDPIIITPQHQIGKYRCDFLIQTCDEKTSRHYKEVIVECDSQEFHDRSEKERRYEKQRDRFFTSKGYKTLHFTGKEIMESPFKCSAEIFCYLFDSDQDDVICEISNYLDGEI